MVEALIAVALVTWFVGKAAPRAIADVAESLRASKAGAWDHLDRQHARRAEVSARRAGYAERVAQAWRTRRAMRALQAGGGEVRPGLRHYLGDVYHGAWEDALARRQARRAAREPFDPAAPGFSERFAGRVDDAVARGVARVRGRRAALADEHVEPEPGEQIEPVADETPEPTADSDPEPPPQPSEPAPATSEPATDGGSDPSPAPTSGGQIMTAPNTSPAAVATEVNTNEEARRNFAEMQKAAADLSEALAQAESARARIAAAGQATADSMSAKRFDSGATAAAQQVADTISLGTLAQWAEAADGAHGAAGQGLAHLEKYRDAEDLVASERVDASTLDASSS